MLHFGLFTSSLFKEKLFFLYSDEVIEKVINSGPYSLMTNYADLFMVDNNNNTESMFALQWVPNGDYGVNNTQQAYFALGSDITGDDAAWGYWTRASYNVLQEYESKDLRRRATFMGDGDHYAEINNGSYGNAFFIGTPHKGSDIIKFKFLIDTNEFLIGFGHGGLPKTISDTIPEGRGEIGFDLQPGSLFLSYLDSLKLTQKNYFIFNANYTGMGITDQGGAKNKAILYAVENTILPAVKKILKERRRRKERSGRGADVEIPTKRD